MSIGSSQRAVDAAVGLILLIAAIALFLHLSSTDDELSRYNPQWNGTSAVFEALEGRGSVRSGTLPSSMDGITRRCS